MGCSSGKGVEAPHMSVPIGTGPTAAAAPKAPTSDPYMKITEQPEQLLAGLSAVLEMRAAEPEQTAIRTKVMMEALDGLKDAVVLEVGCGTGAVARSIATLPGVAKVIGVDPSPFFLDKARAASSEISFQEASSTKLPCDDESVDLVVFWSVLCHVPKDEHAQSLLEAKRVLKPAGRIVLSDNDFSSWSMTDGPDDLLTAPLEKGFLSLMKQNFYVSRKFPSMLKAAAFEPQKLQIHPIVYDDAESYGFKHIMLRSIQFYLGGGKCTQEEADAMTAEAKRRIESKEFQCLTTYATCIGAKSAKPSRSARWPARSS